MMTNTSDFVSMFRSKSVFVLSSPNYSRPILLKIALEHYPNFNDLAKRLCMEDVEGTLEDLSKFHHEEGILMLIYLVNYLIENDTERISTWLHYHSAALTENFDMHRLVMILHIFQRVTGSISICRDQLERTLFKIALNIDKSATPNQQFKICQETAVLIRRFNADVISILQYMIRLAYPTDDYGEEPNKFMRMLLSALMYQLQVDVYNEEIYPDGFFHNLVINREAVCKLITFADTQTTQRQQNIILRLLALIDMTENRASMLLFDLCNNNKFNCAVKICMILQSLDYPAFSTLCEHCISKRLCKQLLRFNQKYVECETLGTELLSNYIQENFHGITFSLVNQRRNLNAENVSELLYLLEHVINEKFIMLSTHNLHLTVLAIFLILFILVQIATLYNVGHDLHAQFISTLLSKLFRLSNKLRDNQLFRHVFLQYLAIILFKRKKFQDTYNDFEQSHTILMDDLKTSLKRSKFIPLHVGKNMLMRKAKSAQFPIIIQNLVVTMVSNAYDTVLVSFLKSVVELVIPNARERFVNFPNADDSQLINRSTYVYQICKDVPSLLDIIEYALCGDARNCPVTIIYPLVYYLLIYLTYKFQRTPGDSKNFDPFMITVASIIIKSLNLISVIQSPIGQSYRILNYCNSYDCYIILNACLCYLKDTRWPYTRTGTNATLSKWQNEFWYVAIKHITKIGPEVFKEIFD
ncbi:hypothetical protein GJ496_000265 [Pomphorhynchus laevis]|nr:hypothetical protein GJ496_000265 [Pomphorhynchus laevis]